MSRRKLTPQEKVLFIDMLDYSSGRDRLLVIWWDLFQSRRRWILIDWLSAGMSWRGALAMAKVGCDESPGAVYRGIDTPRAEWDLEGE